MKLMEPKSHEIRNAIIIAGVIALVIWALVLIMDAPVAHSLERHTCYASRYGGPGECYGRTACGLPLTLNSVWTANRTLPMHSAVLIRWRGAKIVLRVLDRGPAAWTGCDFDLTNKAVCILAWRANYRPIYRGWHWVQIGLWNGKHGTWHKWRKLVGWKQVHHYVWSGRQRITWNRA